MNEPRVYGIVDWTIRILGRALIGALAGLVVLPLTLSLATKYFRLHLFEDSVQGDRTFWKVSGLGVVAFAVLAAIFGKAEIRGRTGTAIKGMLAGAMAGIVFGATLGSMTGPGMPQKVGGTFGILLGGPLGAIVGGLLGVGSYTSSGMGPPSTIDGLKPEDARE